jgi:cbb3-type cytochrome oxidase maturation protein
MESLYLLVPLAGLFVAVAVGLFIWAVRKDQFDDLDREGERILFDDEDDK